MAKQTQSQSQSQSQETRILLVASSPHLNEPSTSKRVMYEVVISLLPAIAAAVWLFRWPAARLLIGCLVAAILTEWVFNIVRKKAQTVADGSVIVTGLILALSLPPTLPVWMGALGTAVAVAVAKMLFGGLGSNIFNPAMVGRAFLLACFGMYMTTWVMPETEIIWSHIATTAKTTDNSKVCVEPVLPADMSPDKETPIDAVTQQTPLAMAKQAIKDSHNADIPQQKKQTAAAVNVKIRSMFIGDISGSAGETSALVWLIGGVFLLLRRTITYHIPLAVLGSAMVIATTTWLINDTVFANPLVHLCGGGLMMCAFFIATDPVTCPLSKLGRVIFGIGVGGLIMLIRLQGGYPEGVMYAVLLMNAMTPLLDRWTRPKPLGGHVPSVEQAD